MMVRVLEKEPSDAVRHAARLREDIEAARKQLAELGEKAYVELASLGESERVETARVIRDTVDSLSRRFPELSIEAEIDSVGDVLIAGGAVSLRSMLYNLANNAREGDGRAGATRLRLRASAEEERVEIVIEDDGPGFGPGALEVAGRSSVTTKEHGLGLGLVMVSELVRASGGTLATENLPRGGARLVISLPAAPS